MHDLLRHIPDNKIGKHSSRMFLLSNDSMSLPSQCNVAIVGGAHESFI